MPYASGNKSKSGIKRGGVSHKRASNNNALAQLAQQLVSGGPILPADNNNDLAALLMQATGEAPPAEGTTTYNGIPPLTQADKQAKIDPGFLLHPKKQPKPPSALDQFTQQLMGIAQDQFGLNNADYEQALQDSADQIKKAFASEIGAVRASNAGARKDTKKGQKQVQAMYRALQRNYNHTAKNESKSGNKLAGQIQTVANNAQNQISGSANKILDEQAALAKGLGVESAMPEVAATQQDTLQKQIQKTQHTGQRAANQALQYSGSQHRFLVRGGQNARLEGTNRAADLQSQLQDFLDANRGKIADLRGQRSQALASNESSLASSMSDAQDKAYSNLFNQLMSIANLKSQVENTNADNKLARQEFAYKQFQDSLGNGSGSNKFMDALPSFMSDIGTIVSKANQPKKVKALIDNLLGSREFVQGRFSTGPNGSGELLKLTPEKAGAMAYRQAIKNGLSQKDANLAKLAAMRAAQG